MKDKSERKRPSLAPLGESEMEMLHLVWEMGPSTVAAIHDRVCETRSVAYTTVMTQLRKLADKGFLSFTQEGSAYVYHAEREPGDVRRSVLESILAKVFKGSAVDLIATLVEHERLSDDELAEIWRIITGQQGPAGPGRE